jgi:hypothetical protein
LSGVLAEQRHAAGDLTRGVRVPGLEVHEQDRQAERDPQRRVEAQEPPDREPAHGAALERERDHEPAHHEEHADRGVAEVDREVVEEPVVDVEREVARQPFDRVREDHERDEVLLLELDDEVAPDDDDRGEAPHDVREPDHATAVTAVCRGRGDGSCHGP